MLILLLLLALISIASCITFLVGLVKVFQKESRETGIKLLIFSTISFIIGYGSCASIMSSGRHF